MEEPTNTESLQSTEPPASSPITGIMDTAKKVITNPAGFFREMPKTGGFTDPLVFMVVMGVASALVGLILSVVGLGFAGTFGMALASIIIVPIITAIIGFVVAAVLFVIWKIIGSQESYETAYRCCAYMAAISPITTVINAIPYIGAVIGLAWGLFLIVTASEEVHKVARKVTWIVFGIIFILFAFSSIGSQCAARKMKTTMSPWTERMEEAGEMSPQEAGKAAGEFFKGLQEAAEKNKHRRRIGRRERKTGPIVDRARFRSHAGIPGYLLLRSI